VLKVQLEIQVPLVIPVLVVAKEKGEMQAPPVGMEMTVNLERMVPLVDEDLPEPLAIQEQMDHEDHPVPMVKMQHVRMVQLVDQVHLEYRDNPDATAKGESLDWMALMVHQASLELSDQPVGLVIVVQRGQKENAARMVVTEIPDIRAHEDPLETQDHLVKMAYQANRDNEDRKVTLDTMASTVQRVRKVNPAQMATKGQKESAVTKGFPDYAEWWGAKDPMESQVWMESTVQLVHKAAPVIAEIWAQQARRES
jgi:hypothetical protein